MKNLIYILLLLIFTSCVKSYDSCTDYRQNQHETGIDCGGECKPCPTCSDGILNQNETGVDCGGECSVCATCSDAIKNQNETGVDCGGTQCLPCNGGDCGLGLDSIACNFIITKKTSIYNDYYTNAGASGDYFIKIDLPMGIQVNGFKISFSNLSSLLNMPAGTTQRFVTTSKNHSFDWKANECHFLMQLPLDNLTAYDGQNVFVTKLGANYIDIKFCNIQIQPNQSNYPNMDPVSGYVDCNYNP